MGREYPQRPILGVGLILIRGEEVLLVRRGREPSRGLYSVPGGGVTDGETSAETASRELREETGLSARVEGLVEIVERLHRDEGGRVRYHYVIVDFWAREFTGDPAPGGDADEVVWASPAMLASLPTTEGLIEVVEKAKTL